jgi:isopenicillin N synthase-like dioxygenase
MSTTTLKTRFGEIEVAKDIVQGDFDTIPVIDLANMKHPDLAERKKVASEIYNACARVGFFYIKVRSHTSNHPNHTISQQSNRTMEFPRSQSRRSMMQLTSTLLFHLRRRWRASWANQRFETQRRCVSRA